MNNELTDDYKFNASNNADWCL